MNDYGFFSIQVLTEALKNFDIEICPLSHPSMAHIRKNPQLVCSLIIAERGEPDIAYSLQLAFARIPPFFFAHSCFLFISPKKAEKNRDAGYQGGGKLQRVQNSYLLPFRSALFWKFWNSNLTTILLRFRKPSPLIDWFSIHRFLYIVFLQQCTSLYLQPARTLVRPSQIRRSVVWVELCQESTQIHLGHLSRDLHRAAPFWRYWKIVFIQ